MTPGRQLRLAGVGETQCHNGYYRCSDHNTFFFYEMGCYRCYMNLIFNTAIQAIKDWPRQVNNNDTVFGQDASRLAHNPIKCTESITTGEGSTQLSDCILFFNM